MKQLTRLNLAAAMSILVAFVPGAALATTATETFLLVAEAPNVGIALGPADTEGRCAEAPDRPT